MYQELKSSETVLVGSWINEEDKILADSTCKRIDWLIANSLNRVTSDKTGWETLYQDINDNRYWVLSYPNSDWHGGGPPTLRTISLAEVRSKFIID